MPGRMYFDSLIWIFMTNVLSYVFSKFLRCFDFSQKEVSLCLHNNIFRHGNLIKFQYQLSY